MIHRRFRGAASVQTLCLLSLWSASLASRTIHYDAKGNGMMSISLDTELRKVVNYKPQEAFVRAQSQEALDLAEKLQETANQAILLYEQIRTGRMLATQKLDSYKDLKPKFWRYTDRNLDDFATKARSDVKSILFQLKTLGLQVETIPTCLQVVVPTSEAFLTPDPQTNEDTLGQASRVAKQAIQDAKKKDQKAEDAQAIMSNEAPVNFGKQRAEAAKTEADRLLGNARTAVGKSVEWLLQNAGKIDRVLKDIKKLSSPAEALIEAEGLLKQANIAKSYAVDAEAAQARKNDAVGAFVKKSEEADRKLNAINECKAQVEEKRQQEDAKRKAEDELQRQEQKAADAKILPGSPDAKLECTSSTSITLEITWDKACTFECRIKNPSGSVTPGMTRVAVKDVSQRLVFGAGVKSGSTPPLISRSSPYQVECRAMVDSATSAWQEVGGAKTAPQKPVSVRDHNGNCGCSESPVSCIQRLEAEKREADRTERTRQREQRAIEGRKAIEGSQLSTHA